MSTLAAITIICGVCHCASVAKDVQPCDYSFVMRSPGSWELTGTKLTVTYDLGRGSYTVQDGDAQAIFYDQDAAERGAIDMVQKLRSVGMTP